MAKQGDSNKNVDEIEAYFAEAKRHDEYKDKDLDTAISLWKKFAYVQAHRLYLRMYWSAAVLSVCTLVPIVASRWMDRTVIPWAIGFYVVVILLDRVRLNGMVERYNVEARKRRIRDGVPERPSYEVDRDRSEPAAQSALSVPEGSYRVKYGPDSS